MAEINTSSQRGGRNIRRQRLSLRIDMTPMVDLAFLLITFFMLTTVLTKPFVIKIEKPKDDESTSNQRRTIHEKDLITVVLGENNNIYWFTGSTNPKVSVTNFSANGIRKILLTKKAEVKGLHVFIKATDLSRYQNLIDILDEVLIAEIKNYSIMDMTQDDDKLIAEFKTKESGR